MDAAALEDVQPQRLHKAPDEGLASLAKSPATAGKPGRASASAVSEDETRSTLAALPDAPMFIILDLRLVPTIDATAAKTLAALNMSMASRGIQVGVGRCFQIVRNTITHRLLAKM